MKYNIMKFWEGYVCELDGFGRKNLDKLYFYGRTKSESLNFALNYTKQKTFDKLNLVINNKKICKKID